MRYQRAAVPLSATAAPVPVRSQDRAGCTLMAEPARYAANDYWDKRYTKDAAEKRAFEWCARSVGHCPG